MRSSIVESDPISKFAERGSQNQDLVPARGKSLVPAKGTSTLPNVLASLAGAREGGTRMYI